MTSPMPPYTFQESAPDTARRATQPEDIACAVIYASVILLFVTRVLFQVWG